MATHVAGRRHRDVVTRADQAARTSFVLDFPSCTRPADLVALFSVYGHVDNVHIGSHKKVAGQFRGKRDKGLEQKLLTRHIVIFYFYRP